VKTVSTLADLVAPVEVSQFLTAVWGRTHRRFAGQPGRFAGLMPWAELNRVLLEHRLDFPRLRLAVDGAVVPAHEYTEQVTSRRGGQVPRLLAAPLAQRLRGGATLVLDAVEELVGPVGELAARLEHELRERVQVNLYAGWGTTHGFDVHWDDHDALIVQVTGRKRWRIYGATRPAPLHRDVATPTRPEGDPVEDLMLEDGDVLYVPRGHWHDASAVGVPSLHLTIGVNQATGVDLVSWLVDQVRADEAFRADLPRFGLAEDRARLAAQLRAKLAELMTPDVVDRFLTDRDAHAPAQARLGLPWSATADPIPDGDATLVRFLAPRAVLQQGESTVILLAAGRRLTFAAPAGPILAALVNGHPWGTPWPVKALAELAAPDLDDGAVRALLCELTRLGVLTADPVV
jgi:Cupin superfamily protein